MALLKVSVARLRDCRYVVECVNKAGMDFNTNTVFSCVQGCINNYNHFKTMIILRVAIFFMVLHPGRSDKYKLIK